MFDHAIRNARQAAARTARTAVIGLGAGLCLLVGAAFLTLAAWLFLITVTTTLNAALIVGGTYFGLGLILIGVLSSGGGAREANRRSSDSHSDDEHLGPKIIAAFVSGLLAGRRTQT